MLWVLVTYVVVTALLLSVDRAHYAIGLAAFATVGFLAVGFAVFPSHKAELTLPVGPFGPQECGRRFRFIGLEIEGSPFQQQYVCRIRLRRWLPLLLSAAVATMSFLVVASDVPLLPVLRRRLLIGQAWWLATLLALSFSSRWYSERVLLSRAAVALGMPGYAGDGTVAYNFFDQAGERRGAIEKDVDERAPDDAILVIFDVRDPDRNRSSRGFFFHEFTATPARDA